MAETKLITLDNLSTYKNLTDEQIGSVKSELEQKIADLSLPIKIVTSLPTASADCLNTLYLIAASDSGSNDIYQEYICYGVDNDDDGKYDAYYWEKFGTVSMTEIVDSQTTGTTYGSTVVTGVSASGNTVAVTSATLTASTLGALTGITVSGAAEDSDNVVSAVSLNSDGNGISVTYSQITPSGIGAATSSEVSAISGAATSAGVASATTSDTKVTSAITNLGAVISGNVLTITPTISPIDLVSSLTDLGYDVATTTEIEALFA